MRAPGGGRKSNNTGTQVSSLTRAVSPPDELLGEMAVDAWRRTCKILINRGTFEMEDCYLLMEYCNTVQLLYDANQEIKSNGLGDDTAAGGQKLGAAVKARSKYISELIRLSVVLKLDPNSRIRKKQPGDHTNPGNEFDEF
ncbi:P27 family phage terminase small subunit [Citrobacter europaeus]|uniref:P27 family phage terminase small subunit n=1 Tax=Citrobacter TaxID=544 RepID=UPI001D08C0CC|nr:P27 family phage terminase small subunit [Citrobacter europaeus]MCB6776104.1 P27 family phage terminase small subunit [Citrobacter sp. 210820-DFI.7.8]MCB8602250.1 P27 family phage terminase small subunit [Citrobacter europaeus]MCQ5005248.1 P27 family phage terminase small subunit [Citrobacter europaeus]